MAQKMRWPVERPAISLWKTRDKGWICRVFAVSELAAGQPMINLPRNCLIRFIPTKKGVET